MKIFLKPLYCTAILFSIIVSASAQTELPKNLPNFLFPEFSRATIKLKAGNEYAATINYNLVDEEMVFLQGDTYMVLSDPLEIDTITTGGRIFVPFSKGFYELIYHDSLMVFMQHKSNVEPVGKPGAYGTTSQTSTGYHRQLLYGPIGSVKLSLPDNLKVTADDQYWVTKNKEMEKFYNKKQFLKIFKDKEQELNKYFNAQKVDFKKQEDVVKLVDYCAKLYK